MSDIGGEQNTGIIKVTVEADGKQSKGFIDIAKTLENMGVWVPKVAEQIEKLGKTVDNLNTSLEKTKKVAPQSKDFQGVITASSNLDTTKIKNVKKNNGSGTPNKQIDSFSSKVSVPASVVSKGKAPKAVNDLLQAEKEHVQALTEYTEALTNETKEKTKYIADNVKLRDRNISYKERMEPYDVAAKSAFSDNLTNPTLVNLREVRADYEVKRILSGNKDIDDFLRQEERFEKLAYNQSEQKKKDDAYRNLKREEEINYITSGLKEFDEALKRSAKEISNERNARKSLLEQTPEFQQYSQQYRDQQLILRDQKIEKQIYDKDYRDSGNLDKDRELRRESLELNNELKQQRVDYGNNWKNYDDQLKRIGQELINKRREQSISKENFLNDRRSYSRFNRNELFKESLRDTSSRLLHSAGFAGAAARIGSYINPGEILSKKTPSGTLLKNTGVAKGGLITGFVVSGIEKVTDSMIRLGKTALNAYGSMSKLETSLGVVFGSQSQASVLFDEITEYAVKSPFGVEKVTEMAILLKQSGIYESDLMDTLETIGDLAGGNEEKYRRIANNYAQVLAIGKATTKDMREFANAGIPIFDATADYLGISRKSLSAEIEEGKITAQVLEGVFKQLTSEGGVFYKATDKNAETYSAKKTNLEDTKNLTWAALGEALYSGAIFGNYGQRSTAQEMLSAEEAVYEFAKEKIDAKILKEQRKALERNSDMIEYLTEELDEALSSGVFSEEYVQSIRDNLESERKLFSQEEKVQMNTELYDDIMDKTGHLTFYNLQDLYTQKRDLEKEDYLNRALSMEVARSGGAYEDYEKFLIRGEQIALEIGNLNLSIKSLEEELSKLSPEILYGKTISFLETTSRRSAESLDKNLSYNQSSLTNLNTYIDDLYKNTDAYKEDLEQEKQNKLKDFKELVLLIEQYKINGQGINFAKGKGFTLEAFNKILDDFFTGESIIDETFKLNSRNVSLAKNNLEVIKTFEDLSFSQRNFLSELESLLQRLSANGASNSADVENLGSFLMHNSLDADLNDLIEKIFVKYQTFEASDKYAAILEDEENKKKEKAARFTPLWARIAEDAFDIAAEKLEWTSFQSEDLEKKAYSHHGYGLQTYIDASYVNPNYSMKKDFRGSMMNRNGVEALLRASGTDYLNKLIFAKNANGEYITNVNGVKQYDWDKSFKNLEGIALSLNSTVEMSNALAEYYKAEREKFTTYATEGIIAKEDWSNLMNEDFAKEMGIAGEHFDQLQNALSAEYTVLEDGTIQLTHAGMQIALEMEKMLEPMEALTGQFDKLKHAITEVVASTELANLKKSARTSKLFGTDLSDSQQEKLVEDAYSIIKEELDKLGLDKEQRKAYLAQSFDFIQKALNGDTSNFSKQETIFEQEAALANAIVEMVNATKQNTSALIGSELSKKLSETGGELSFDLMSYLGTGNVSTVNSLGETGEQQRILNSLGVSNYSYNQLKTALQDEQNADLLAQMEKSTGLKATEVGMDTLLNQFSLLNDAAEQFDRSMSNVANGTLAAFANFATSGIVSTFETIGESLVTSENASENLVKALKNMYQNLASQISTLLVTEGLRTMGFGATNNSRSIFLTGLGMVAAGGFGSILSGMMKADSEDNKAEEEMQKLQNIKDMLADLLAQARIDAEYYEKNLRHQYAISANEAISSYKVNDAVITPKGDIISTHPDDWLIATKTPHELGGGSAPVVTITIVNESGNTVQVARTEQQRNGNNIDIKAIVVATMNEAVADGSLDSGLAMYQQRQRGKIVSY